MQAASPENTKSADQEQVKRREYAVKRIVGHYGEGDGKWCK